MNTADRKLMQAILEAMEDLYRTGDTQVFDLYAAPELIPALRERLAHCDRCGKKLGGEGDIHTCTPDPIGDAQSALIAEMAAQPEQEPVIFCMHWEDRWGVNHYVDPKEPHPAQAKPLYTTPPAAQHQCKWPTCQSEEYQQALAEQINQELVTGAAQQEMAHDMMRDALTIGSAWVRDGKRLEPTSVYKGMEDA